MIRRLAAAAWSRFWDAIDQRIATLVDLALAAEHPLQVASDVDPLPPEVRVAAHRLIRKDTR